MIIVSRNQDRFSLIPFGVAPLFHVNQPFPLQHGFCNPVEFIYTEHSAVPCTQYLEPVERFQCFDGLIRKKVIMISFNDLLMKRLISVLRFR